jgi:hypothetical protein
MTKGTDYDPLASKEGDDRLDDDEFELEVADIVPVGAWAAMVTDVHKQQSAAGNPMWVWELIIAEGPGAGQKLRTYTAITTAAAWKVAQVLAALGLLSEDGKAKFKTSDARGKWCIANIVHEKFEGMPRASIGKMEPWPKSRKKKPNIKQYLIGEDTPF